MILSLLSAQTTAASIEECAAACDTAYAAGTQCYSVDYIWASNTDNCQFISVFGE